MPRQKKKPMLETYKKFLGMAISDKIGVFIEAADLLQVPPEYIEKDFWVCLTLDILFNSPGIQSHKLLFKGGTALSKSDGLIQRFSEDIDIVVFRDDLGFGMDKDPTNRSLVLGSKARRSAFDDLKRSCQAFMRADLAAAVAHEVRGLDCTVCSDQDDVDGMTVLLNYKSLFKSTGYVKPIVKIEGGARSGLTPHAERAFQPYIAQVVPSFDFSVIGVRTIDPSRTFWEKVLILHGLHCGYRDEQRLPNEANRLSRHYYDLAMLSLSDVSEQAIADIALLDEVREHNLIVFNQKWKKFGEAIPGGILIYPQAELAKILANDYRAMSGMIMGDAPSFDTILEELQRLHNRINHSASAQQN